jgi:alpha-glucosidase
MPRTQAHNMSPFVAFLSLATLGLASHTSWAAERLSVSSPDGRIEADIWLDAQGAPHYSVRLSGKEILAPSRLGLIRDDADFSQRLRLASVSPVEQVRDSYEMRTSKRRINHYLANRRTVHLRNAGGEQLQIIFQLSNDGVAFRYFFPQETRDIRRVRAETSSFRFLSGTQAYLQPVAVAKTGFGETNPSYEEIYEQAVSVGTPSSGAGWAFPALFRSGDTWLLLSETGLGRNYCGARLQSRWRDPEYTIAFPSPLEGTSGGPVNPESKLPWLTPWRLIVIGNLATIVESTLGTDLADKPTADQQTPADAPGKASWSWPLLGDAKTDAETQRRFIDYAAQMGWRYTLIDALWDQQIGYEKLKELVEYGRSKNVRILVWYNSAGDWNTAPQTPRNVMLTRESRMREFARLKAIGIAGLKVDFFAGDGQSTIAYYHDILEDAARYGLLMNFHGSTLPRGWHRTYPHLMTMEAVRGLEYVTFDQKNAEDEPSHAAMLPFTRNVFDPMDFTPVVLDRIPGIERRTSSAFELALSVLFTSGIQHYAEIPEGMAKAPDYVQAFLGQVPSIWDDVRFLAGDPGKYVVLARYGGGHWYVAGINADKSKRTLHLDLSTIGASVSGSLIIDGEEGSSSFQRRALALGPTKIVDIELKPRGGFVVRLD